MTRHHETGAGTDPRPTKASPLPGPSADMSTAWSLPRSSALPPMSFSDEEREFLSAMRALALDAAGEEVFVGLDRRESIEYWRLTRGDARSSEETERYRELHDKHEAARQPIAEGRA